MDILNDAWTIHSRFQPYIHHTCTTFWVLFSPFVTKIILRLTKIISRLGAYSNLLKFWLTFRNLQSTRYGPMNDSRKKNIFFWTELKIFFSFYNILQWNENTYEFYEKTICHLRYRYLRLLILFFIKYLIFSKIDVTIIAKKYVKLLHNTVYFENHVM